VKRDPNKSYSFDPAWCGEELRMCNLLDIHNAGVVQYWIYSAMELQEWINTCAACICVSVNGIIAVTRDIAPKAMSVADYDKSEPVVD